MARESQIQIHRTEAAGATPSGLTSGELAVNLRDQKLFVGLSSGGYLTFNSAVSSPYYTVNGQDGIVVFSDVVGTGNTYTVTLNRDITGNTLNITGNAIFSGYDSGVTFNGRVSIGNGSGAWGLYRNPDEYNLTPSSGVAGLVDFTKTIAASIDYANRVGGKVAELVPANAYYPGVTTVKTVLDIDSITGAGMFLAKAYATTGQGNLIGQYLGNLGGVPPLYYKNAPGDTPQIAVNTALERALLVENINVNFQALGLANTQIGTPFRTLIQYGTWIDNIQSPSGLGGAPAASGTYETTFDKYVRTGYLLRGGTGASGGATGTYIWSQWKNLVETTDDLGKYGVATVNGGTGDISITGAGSDAAVVVRSSVAGTNYIDARMATSSLTGVASFHPGHFTVTEGRVVASFSGGVTFNGVSVFSSGLSATGITANSVFANSIVGTNASFASGVTFSGTVSGAVKSFNGNDGVVTITGAGQSIKVTSTVAGTHLIDARIASLSVTGVASFDSRHFALGASGHVSLTGPFSVTGDTVVAGNGISVSRLNNQATVTNTGVTGIGFGIDSGLVGKINLTGAGVASSQVITVSGNQVTLDNRLATISATGVASFNSAEFTVSSVGAVSLSTGNTFEVNTTTANKFNVALGGKLTLTASGAIRNIASSPSEGSATVTFDTRMATSSLTGVASFDPRHFALGASGHVSLTGSFSVTGDTVVAGNSISVSRLNNQATITNMGVTGIGFSVDGGGLGLTGRINLTGSAITVSGNLITIASGGGGATTSALNTWTKTQTFNGGIQTTGLTSTGKLSIGIGGYISQDVNFADGDGAWARGTLFNDSVGVTAGMGLYGNGLTPDYLFFGHGNAPYNPGQVALTVKKNGNIGIATTTPQAKLDVVGDAIVRGGLSASGGLFVTGGASIGGGASIWGGAFITGNSRFSNNVQFDGVLFANTNLTVSSTASFGVASSVNFYNGFTVNNSDPTFSTGILQTSSNGVTFTGNLSAPNIVNKVTVGGATLTGNVSLTSGSNVTMTVAGNQVTIASSGSGGVPSVNGDATAITITGAGQSIKVTSTVAGTHLIDARLATASLTGVASFDSSHFTVTNGKVVASFSGGVTFTGTPVFSSGLSATGITANSVFTNRFTATNASFSSGVTFSGTVSGAVKSFNGNDGVVTITGAGQGLGQAIKVTSTVAGTHLIDARLASTSLTGVAYFDSTAFIVNANGYVQLNGGGGACSDYTTEGTCLSNGCVWCPNTQTCVQQFCSMFTSKNTGVGASANADGSLAYLYFDPANLTAYTSNYSDKKSNFVLIYDGNETGLVKAKRASLENFFSENAGLVTSATTGQLTNAVKKVPGVGNNTIELGIVLGNVAAGQEGLVKGASAFAYIETNTVRSFNGLTGAVTAVGSINGCTAAVVITGSASEIEVLNTCPNIVIGLPDNVTISNLNVLSGATFGGNISAKNVVTSVNGATGPITNVAKTNVSNDFTSSQQISNSLTVTGFSSPYEVILNSSTISMGDVNQEGDNVRLIIDNGAVGIYAYGRINQYGAGGIESDSSLVAPNVYASQFFTFPNGQTATSIVTTVNGATGAVTITGDSGSVIGIQNNKITARIATASVTGVASFDSRHFALGASGHVSLTGTYQVTGHTVVSGGASQLVSVSGNIATIDNRIATASVTGVASFGNEFVVTSGAVGLTSNYVKSINGATGAVTIGTAPSWSVITADQTAAINSGYITNKTGTVLTLTLPTTAAVGSVIRVSGMNATGWKIAQNASGIIHFGKTDTTTGTGGYIQSTLTRDAVELVCCVANNEWNVISSVGNITIV